MADSVIRCWAAKVMSETKMPRTYSEAMKHPKHADFNSAAQSEYDLLTSKGTWKYVRRSEVPTGVKIHHGMWVFRQKCDKDGQPDRLKGRYVFIGSQQHRGADYDDTFAPTGRPSTMRMCHAVASATNMVVKHADCEGAFLNAYVSDDDISDRQIYMEQVEGFADADHPKSEWVCLMVKTLYGMKQSNRLWWKRLAKWMVNYGFKQSKYDPCFFFGNTKGKKWLKGVHYVPIIVDDISAYLANSKTAAKNYDDFIKNLNKTYATVDKGPIEFYLQQYVAADPVTHSYHISQEAHLDKMLEKQGMADSHSASLPFNTGHMHSILKQGRAAPDDEAADPAINPSTYRNMTGSLGYPAVMSRPDISCTTSILQRYQSAPRRSHQHAAKHAMRYLNGTRNLGIKYKGGPVQLKAAVDTSWADDVDEAESQYGWIVFLCGGIVSWKSGLMRCTATSSTEAEYVGLADLVCELLYLTSLLKEMGFPQQPVPVDEDNQGVLSVAMGEGKHSHQRHINIKYHLCRKFINTLYTLNDVRGTLNVADILTKPLIAKERFKQLVAMILDPVT